MEIGLNLSFAVKRWMKPQQLAKMCRNDFGVKHIQFSWDLIDPWWPEEKRNLLLSEHRKAFKDEGVEIDSYFAGTSAYSYPHFLAPTATQRGIALEFFKRAADSALELGCKVFGSPVGGMNYDDARNEKTREELYKSMIENLHLLADYSKNIGLKEIHIEATPLWTEFPHSPDVSLQLMKDLEDSAIPFKLLIDWGHALFKPLLKDEADMTLWLTKCKKYVGAIHLQQTDGLWDRHWDFTAKGIVTPEYIKKAMSESGLEDIPQYLEIVPIFEDEDDHVYDGIKKSMDYLRANL